MYGGEIWIWVSLRGVRCGGNYMGRVGEPETVQISTRLSLRGCGYVTSYIPPMSEVMSAVTLLPKSPLCRN